jgi:hypothetical protein
MAINRNRTRPGIRIDFDGAVANPIAITIAFQTT